MFLSDQLWLCGQHCGEKENVHGALSCLGCEVILENLTRVLHIHSILAPASHSQQTSLQSPGSYAPRLITGTPAQLTTKSKSPSVCKVQPANMSHQSIEIQDDEEEEYQYDEDFDFVVPPPKPQNEDFNDANFDDIAAYHTFVQVTFLDSRRKHKASDDEIHSACYPNKRMLLISRLER